MIQLRPFQATLKNDLYNSWANGSNATVLVAPCRSGKTVIMSSIASDIKEPVVIIAHRQELVQQISMAMARMGLRHNIIAPDKTIKAIISGHIRELGQSFFDRKASLTVAGVGTLKARSKSLMQWANTIRYWMIDEAHHVQIANIWGHAVAMFPNARGVGFTATPVRGDRKSLQLGHGGVFTDMCIGPEPRDLIKQGYLCDYNIVAPPLTIDVSEVSIGASGEFVHKSLVNATNKSTITGDIVVYYIKVCAAKWYGCLVKEIRVTGDTVGFPDGTSRTVRDIRDHLLRGITFTVDVKNATLTAQNYRNAGISAEVVSAKTPPNIRNEIIRKFQRGLIMQLVNVDLFGEGFDVPGVQVVSMGRATASLGLFIQQFFRTLTISKGKTHGIIIDHAGNIKRHGLPDAVRKWSLTVTSSGRKSMMKDPDIMPVTTCVKCFEAFEAVTAICPHCGAVQEPESRSEPKFIDGDLIEFSPELLAQLRGDINRVDGEVLVPNAIKGTPAQGRLVRLHGERQIAQNGLRESISIWAGIKRDDGQDDHEIYRRFFHTFGTDIMSAQALKTADAIALDNKIKERYWAK